MEAKHKILVLDDDGDWLDMCPDFLAQLPSKPEIQTVSSGMRALALLNAQRFRVLLCDLKMPRMDGLQVLSIVRRRFPELRTVALTGFLDEEFRSRAYALGVDLFWLKSDMQQKPQMFLDCIESLLGRDDGVSVRFKAKIFWISSRWNRRCAIRACCASRPGGRWHKSGFRTDKSLTPKWRGRTARRRCGAF